jgi:D-cysteine desulfhydrase
MRKLEFIFQDVLAQKADCIVTCGGLQSNHCRATALVARMLGLDSYLLLRTNKPDEDPGLVGNVLFDRLIDAKIIQMSRQEYGRYGSQAMIEVGVFTPLELLSEDGTPGSHSCVLVENV